MRIQRRRTKGWKMPADAMCVTRPGPLGNPFSTATAFRLWLLHGAITVTELVQSEFLPFNQHANALLAMRRQQILQRIPELKGRRLACFCEINSDCHADLLIELANELPRVGQRVKLYRATSQNWIVARQDAGHRYWLNDEDQIVGTTVAMAQSWWGELRSVPETYESVLGGVSNLSAADREAALREIARLCGQPFDDVFRWQIRQLNPVQEHTTSCQ